MSEPKLHSRMMKRLRSHIPPILFMIADYVSVVMTVHLSMNIYDVIIPAKYIYIWLPITYIVFLLQGKAYNIMQPIIYTVKDTFYAISFGMAACIGALHFFTTWQVRSSFFLVFWLFLLVIIFLGRFLLNAWLKYGHHLYEDVIIIGAGKTAERVLHFYREDLGCRYNIVGLIDDHPLSQKLTAEYQHLGKIADVEAILKEHKIQQVIITAPGMEVAKLQQLIVRIQPHVREISFVPDLIGTPMAGIEARELYTEEIIMLHLKNNLSVWRNRMYKRIFDLACVLLGGMVLLPFIAIIAMMVAYDNKGQVIFAHRRIGKNGQEFPCYKFQTMIPNAQEKLEEYLAANPDARKEWEESFKLTDDPRVTKLGSFLRKTSLDELPQLWNVIRGDMSLVGPRPIVRKEIVKYGIYFREYSMVLPGITGMWQTSGRSDTTYEERVAMDTWYVRNWSVWVDIMYLVKTFKAVAFREGAY